VSTFSYLRIQDADLRRRQQYAREHNHLVDEMEMVSMLPRGHLPRHQIPQPSPIYQDRRNMTVTNNHIIVSGGTVGAINTGTIQNLNIAIDQATQRDDAVLAAAIRQLGDAIANHGTMTVEKKNEANECLLFLVEQIEVPTVQRRPAIIRATTDAFLRVLSVTSDLMQVWATVGDPIRQALGI